jgi:type I restriction enzyme S subunit
VDNRGKTVPTTDSGHVLIATNCIKNDTLYPVFEKIRYLSDETYQTWFRSHPKPGDIIFVNKGTPGRVCMVPDPVDFCIAQDMIAFRVDESKVYNKYLFAILRSREIQKQIYNTNVGDVIPHFKKSFLSELLIPIPPKIIQQKIGDIYFDISAKIDINSKINHNLEQTARVIFQEYCLDGEIGKLSDIVEVCYGKDHKKLSDGNIPCYGSGGIMRYVNSFLYKGESVLIPRKGTLNNVIYINEEFWTVDTMFYTKMLVSNVAKFVYFTINSIDLAGMNVGSAVPSMTTAVLNELEIIIPTEKTLAEFEKHVKAIFLQIKANTKDSELLVKSRESLLSRLMNGELSIEG